MSNLDGQGARHKLVMQSLVAALLIVPLDLGSIVERRVVFGRKDAAAHDVTKRRAQAVNLVKGNPELDQALVLVKAELGIAHEKIDELTVGPAAVLLGKRKG